MGERVALKIQRRRFAHAAVREIAVHQALRERAHRSAEIVGLREAFSHDGHICLAFERHGASLEAAVDRRPLEPARVRRATRQLLLALEQMHRCGFTHTDVKPGNILYRARSGDVRLADLGNARNRLRQGSLYGTREYTAPEIILGAPLAPALDMWSLGCTIFEMLTGQLLFNPRKVAAKKYREFSDGAQGSELPLAASVLKDNAEEEAEQRVRGEVIGGKYRLERVLGRGRFSTVWLAEQVTNASLDPAREIVERGAPRTSRKSAHSEQQRRERKWRDAKGADDILDLALNYEQMLLIAALAGPFPRALVQSGRYRASYFEKDGALRFRPVLPAARLRDRLRRGMRARTAMPGSAADFLRHLLAPDPAMRPEPAAALTHPWVAGR